MDPVRVDDGCHAKLTDRSRGNTFAPPPPRFDAPQPSKTLYQGSMEPRNPRVEDSFDADLKRALEMSLEDAKGNSSSGFVPQAQLKSQSKPNGTTKKPAPEPELELDADLEAAIAASLADMEEQKKKYATDFRQQATSSSSGTPFVAPKNDFELSPVEAENINLFSTLVDRMQHQPPGAILREPQIQELYESIGKLRPKLARTYGETMSKHETLLDLHAKLSTVVRYYDRMLEERLSSTYNQAGAMYGMPRPASNVYPQIPTGAPAYTGSENYYSSNPAPSDPYGRPQPTYQSQPQQPYPQFDQRAPPPQSYASPDPYQQQPQQPSQPYPNLASYGAGAPPQQQPPQPSYQQPPSPQLQRQSSTQYTQQPSAYQSQAPPSTVSDAEGANYYYNDSAPTPLQRTQSYTSQPPQTASPQLYNHAPPPQQQQQQAPISPPQQPVSAWQNPPYPQGNAPPQQQQQQQAPPQQQQQQQQQQQAPPQHQQAPPPQQQWQPPPQQQQQQQPQQPPPQQQQQSNWNPATPYAMGGYGPESFPSAPQAAPQPQRVEEPLIDL
jgi:growth factor-regulated tyrosine kinase substrate